MNDQLKLLDKARMKLIEKARNILMCLAKIKQFGPCWCHTIDSTYCVGQLQCIEAKETLEKLDQAMKDN